MGYIYCIENKLNNKKYIGKTLFSVEKRFQRHIIDSRKEVNQNKPLYRAFNKYGIDAFQIYTIEKCDNSILNEREIYWIQFWDTYNSGYNATHGGDGKQIYNITSDKLWEFFIQHKTPTDAANYYHCCVDTISKYSKEYGINWAGHTQRHDIDCFYNGEYVASFYSAGQAARWVIEEGLSEAKADSISANIMRCCKGSRKHCCGFEWKFKDIPVV